MARGQLLDHVRSVAEDGTEVDSPFLILETELWDADQRLATLMLDPGRDKQGVGPNMAGGAPLRAGQSYRLIVSEDMQSAAGVPLDAPVPLAIQVGPAERRAIDPADWGVLVPNAETPTPLTVGFDCIMDTGAVVRSLSLQARDGSRLHGEVTTGGGGRSLAPHTRWTAGIYRLRVPWSIAVKRISGAAGTALCPVAPSSQWHAVNDDEGAFW